MDAYLHKYSMLSFIKIAKLLIQQENLPFEVEPLRKYLSFHKKSQQTTSVDLISTDNDIVIPDSFYDAVDTVVLPNKIRKLLIINDVHIPYHSIEALRSCLKYAKDNNVDAILLNGDIVDFYGLSKFERLPDKRDVWVEIKVAREFLQNLRN
jgi:hypothetical protein